MKWLVRALAVVLTSYSALLLLVFIFQRRLIYFPTRLDPARAEAVARQQGVLAWRSRAGQILGWRWPADVPSGGAVLVVHGNAGSALDRDYLAEPIRSVTSMDVFVLEYPGYGVRAGEPSQATLLAAAHEAFAELAERRPVVIVSESLGAGVAAHLAQRHGERVSSIVMFAPYDNLAAVAQKVMPFLPVRWLLRDRFDPAGWLVGYTGPIAIVLAERDEVIPAERGRRLYDSYGGRKRLFVIAGAGHNDIAGQPLPWWRDVVAFWNAHARPGT